MPYDATDARGFESGLATAVNTVAGDGTRAAEMGAAGRERAIAEFSWDSIAEQTIAVYRQALAS